MDMAFIRAMDSVLTDTSSNIRLNNFFRIILSKIYQKRKPKSKKQTVKQVTIGLYNWIIKNRPSYFDDFCPVCGLPITVKDIQERHFTKDCFMLISKCRKCNFNIQRRFTHEMNEIKT